MDESEDNQQRANPHREIEAESRLGEMDYQAAGFKCGIEIHQQLHTERKLFCRCPAGVYTTEVTGEVLRHMRPTLSELGEYDGTALMEFKTKKNVTYLLNSLCVCTYEMDDTPPFPINQEAVDKAIQIALMFDMNIIDEIHVARKQYLDGSIPTGFQRTAIIGVDGKMPYKDRHINIFQLNVEEDACREVKDAGHDIVYRADRLGMPLIEIITAPDMKTPFEAAEVVELLGRVCKASGNVRRGIGSVRQDVNVSVTGGTRVEIKGVPQYGLIPALTHNEALRQVNLLKLRDILTEFNITPDSLVMSDKVVTELLSDESKRTLFPQMRADDEIRAVIVRRLRGLLNSPTQPSLTFADEIRGRIRVIACIDVAPIMLHTDAFPEYSRSGADRSALYQEFNADDDDVICLVCGAPIDCDTAVKEIRLRIEDATRGIPNETRQAMDDGLTDFERILPGPDRMYPDTDTPPTEIKEDRIEKLRLGVPQVPWIRRENYIKSGLPTRLADEMSFSNYALLFEEAITLGVDAKFAAAALLEWTVAIKRKFGASVIADLSSERLLGYFKAYAAGAFQREIAYKVLKKMAKRNASVEEIIAHLDIKPATESLIESAVAKARAAVFTSRKRHATPEVKWRRFAMGIAMHDLRGRAAGAHIFRLIDKTDDSARFAVSNQG